MLFSFFVFSYFNFLLLFDQSWCLGEVSCADEEIMEEQGESCMAEAFSHSVYQEEKASAHGTPFLGVEDPTLLGNSELLL